MYLLARIKVLNPQSPVSPYFGQRTRRRRRRSDHYFTLRSPPAFAHRSSEASDLHSTVHELRRLIMRHQIRDND